MTTLSTQCGNLSRVETDFQLEGFPLLLSGVIQAIHDPRTVGIRFLDLSARKRDQLEQLIGEIEEVEHTEAMGCSPVPSGPGGPKGQG